MRQPKAYRIRKSPGLRIEPLETRVLLAADLYPVDVHGDALLEHLAESLQSRHDDPLLRHDESGNAYYFDASPPVPQFDDQSDDSDPREVDIPPLHSKPDSTRKIFLDFDGHIVVNTNWNQFNNDLPIHAPPYSTNSNIWTFTQLEVNNIIQAFHRVAEDFAPFDVDVTLEDPSIAEPNIFTVGGRAIRALVSTDVDNVEMGGTGNQWYSNAGGVAYLNSWTWTNDTPVWIFENNLGNGNAKNVAEAASHEVGHAVNLSHDGTPSTTYYGGHGSGETSWAPIMGVGYNRNVTQWSRGEYPNANQLQNDLNIITARIPYRVDDHSNVKTDSTLATPLTVDATALSGTGIVERTTDVDVFRFEVLAESNLNMTIGPYFVGPNLDIMAELFDSSGNLVAVDDVQNKLAAQLVTTLSPGVYTLAIDGVGNGTLDNGYSDYASLGQFTILGTLEPTTPALPGDFNQDGTVDATDIDLLCGEVVGGTNPVPYDLNSDGLVNQLDMDLLILDILATHYGDANLDGLVDGSDFGIWNANRFMSGGWGAGSFNCDNAVDGSDFGVWNANKFTGGTLRTAPLPVAVARHESRLPESRHAESSDLPTIESTIRFRDEVSSARRSRDRAATLWYDANAVSEPLAQGDMLCTELKSVVSSLFRG